ncbi:YbaK/EbsC family protein [Anaerolineales bacterium HSG6]|nr:YbaK/EbsC family protein [Anaerolineales bacterium HSG6]MDM8530108.1 YbaK/EbsC family protein [Anaerolineales bacterium HSG25]
MENNPTRAISTVDSADLHPTSQKLAEFAREHGLNLAIKQFTVSTRTAQDAADAVGCELAQIVKSLVFVVNGEPTMALVSGANRLDLKKLAGLCEVGKKKVKRASADIVREATGFAIGGVPPFGHAQSLRLFIDQDFWQYDLIWAAAGTPNTVFPITPNDLKRVTQGVVADLRVA